MRWNEIYTNRVVTQEQREKDFEEMKFRLIRAAKFVAGEVGISQTPGMIGYRDNFAAEVYGEKHSSITKLEEVKKEGWGLIIVDFKNTAEFKDVPFSVKDYDEWSKAPNFYDRHRVTMAMLREMDFIAGGKLARKLPRSRGIRFRYVNFPHSSLPFTAEGIAETMNHKGNLYFKGFLLEYKARVKDL